MTHPRTPSPSSSKHLEREQMEPFELGPVEMERLKRMSECWRADQPSAREIRDATRRLARPGHRQRDSRAMPGLLVLLAGLFIAGGALAVSGVLPLPRLHAPQATSTAVPDVTPARQAPRTGRKRADHIDPSPTLEPTPEVTAQQPEPTPSKPSKPRGRALPKDLPLASESARARAMSPQASDAWSRAAQALRQGDEPQASQALSELIRADDPTTRDAALLAQAELDAAANRWKRARPVLEKLSDDGATPLIRRRAGEVLASGR